HAVITQGRAIICEKDEAPPEPKPGVDFVGWKDAEWLYLLPDAAFKAVATFCRDSGEPFATRQGRLRRYFQKEGLSECDPERLTKVTKVGFGSYRVLQLNIQAINRAFGIKAWS